MSKATIAQRRIWRGEAKVCPCGKPIYDKKGAVSAKNLRMKNDHVQLRVYHCEISNAWHLTKRL